jgi:hypothetical protein
MCNCTEEHVYHQGTQLRQCDIGAGGAFDSPSGCTSTWNYLEEVQGKWSCRRGARLVREVPRVVHRSQQPRRSQAAEESWAAERARTGGAKSPRQESCPDPLAVNAKRLWLRLGECLGARPGG